MMCLENARFTAASTAGVLYVQQPDPDYCADSPQSPSATRGAFAGWDYATCMSKVSSTQNGQHGLVLCYDERLGQLSFYSLYTNSWVSKANHSWTVGLGVNAIDLPGIDVVECIPAPGADPGFFFKLASTDQAVNDRWAGYDMNSDTWVEYANGPPCKEGSTICSEIENTGAFANMQNQVFVGEGTTRNIHVWDNAQGWFPNPILSPTNNHVFVPGCSMAINRFTGDMYVIWYMNEGQVAYELWRLTFSNGVWDQLASPPLTGVGGPADLFVGKSIQKMLSYYPASAETGNTSDDVLFLVAARNGPHWNAYDPTTDSWSPVNTEAENPGAGRSRRWFASGPTATIAPRKT